MTVITETRPVLVPAVPAWAEREPDEPVTDWLTRLVISYAAIEAGRPGLALRVSNPGGQDPYPRYGRDENDLDEEVPA